MLYSRLLLLLLSGLLLLAGGCASPPLVKDISTPWIDINQVSQEIKKPARRGNVLEGMEQLLPTDKREKVTSLTPAAGEAAENPFLKEAKSDRKEPAPAVEGEGILLNFDNADIYEVIQSIAELMDMNYIIDPNVKGTVNIRSGKKISLDQLFEVFQKMLHLNGLDIRSEGDYYFIHPAKKPGSQAVRGPEELKLLKDSPDMIMQIVPILHLASSEAMTLIEPYLSEQGTVYNLANQNLLIIVDYESKIMDCVLILSRLDISPLSNIKVNLVRIENAPLFDLKTELDEVLTAMQINKKDFQGVNVVPLERVNALLLVSSNEFLMKSVTNWIKELDVVPSGGRDNIYIYNVRNSVASELADLVNSLIGAKAEGVAAGGSRTGSGTGATPRRTPGAGDTGVGSPYGRGSRGVRDLRSSRRSLSQPGYDYNYSATAMPATPVTTQGEHGGAGAAKRDAKPKSTLQFAGEPMLLPDDNRNIILIRALAPDYTRIQKLLERLDNMPRQVLIEVLVAEVQLSNKWSMGIEWGLRNRSKDYFIHSDQIGRESFKDLPDILETAANAAGFRALGKSGDLFGFLQLLATENDFSVLSSPQVLVLNNESAMINVGNEVPILTSFVTASASVGGTTSTSPYDQSVQYKDTGVILDVTPRINDDGIIILDVNQEISSAKEVAKDAGIKSPTISKRQVQTKLAVKDGQSILIGGLIEQNKNEVESGIPLAKDIPLLGNLFKNQSQEKNKTELLIMITPYVVESEDVLDQYIREFQTKVDAIKNRFKK